MDGEHPLKAARCKILRGRQRLQELQDAERLLNDPDEERVVIDFHPDDQCHIASLVLRQLPPPDFALTLGECIHNLRCALDYVTWQLALKRKGREPTRREAQQISFPISDRPEWFAGAAVLAHIDDEAAAELALHQLYSERLDKSHDPSLLRVLRELSNEDKHRLIVVSAQAMNLATADVRWVNPLATSLRSESIAFEEDGPITPPFPFKLAAERMITEPPEVAAFTEFDVRKQPESRIVFEGSGQRLHLRKLDALADCIEFIVDRFDSYF